MIADEAFTARILESISDGVFTVDEEWKISSFNRAAERITGVPRAQAVGRYCFEVFRSNMCESACPLKRTMKTGKPLIDRTGYCVTKKGKRVPISVSTALLTDASGAVIGGAETFRDLSELEDLRKELASRGPNPLFRSKSPSMEPLLGMLPAVAESTASVLIQGETGTGKEVLARALHSLSPRRDGPFVAVNCGAIPESLLESELFGFRKGAFTGADRDKPGRFALAEGGTLFLDEIGDIPASLQVKLLRVLQEREYEPLGGTKPVRTDVRLVTATNRDLANMANDGSFRRDLYYRINVISLVLPPLRERREDIPDLAAGFLNTFAVRMNRTIDGFSPEVFSRFYAYSWPGNIRELENVVERMVVLAKAPEIDKDLLPPELQSPVVCAKDALSGEAGAGVLQVRDEAERDCILAALDNFGWNRARTAQALDIDKATLWRKMKKYGINRP
ncbi:MAG TPA: sigma 54-interacting transcriptional regulator [Treponemataceae bacterium]|nr:sigma 54-interacting transcriptional regulator [Treponemataceae bacterium]